MNTWKQKSRLTQANLTSEPSANLAQEQSPMVRYFQEAAAGEQSHPLELDKQMRSRMERQFGLDFSAVRLVESDLPGKLGADAVAQGDLIRFAPGTFHPETAQGEQLLSHELSHVVQQSRGVPGGKEGVPLYDAALERGADVMAAQAMAGELAAGPVQAFTPISSVQAPMQGGGGASAKVHPPKKASQPSAQRQSSRRPSLYLSLIEGETPDSAQGQSSNGPVLNQPPVVGQTPSQSVDLRLINLYRSTPGDNSVPGWVVNTVEDWLENEQQNAKKPELPEWLYTRQMANEERNALKERYYEARTAWENRCLFNPKNDKNLRNNLEAIDKATTVREAQAAFKAIPGNNNIGGDIGDSKYIDMMNPRSVKLRLKGMVRMLDDIPQLRGQVDMFGGTKKDDPSVMKTESETSQQQGKKSKMTILWAGHEDSYMFGNSLDVTAREKRKLIRIANEQEKHLTAKGRWQGTHELGHILQFMLDDELIDSIGDPGNLRFSTRNIQAEFISSKSGITAASVVQQAISELVTDPSFAEDEKVKKLKRFLAKKEYDGSTTGWTEEEVKKGLENLDLVDYVKAGGHLKYFNPEFPDDDLEKRVEDYNKTLQALFDMELTSKYGASNISELFAEAFADYYGNQEEANPLSKKIVKIAKARTDKTNKQEWVTKEREKLLKLINLPPPPSQ